MEPQEAINEFVTSLKESYRERQLICEEQWPPVRGDRLINLQLVETDKVEGFSGEGKTKYTPILRNDLFKVEQGKKPVRKLIVEGNAGMGKTTLCTMLVEEWAEDKIFPEFNCVLLLPLRDPTIITASCLSNFLAFYHPDESICDSVVQHLKRTRGKNLLIIADGWDELGKEKQSKQSLFYSLLFGRQLPSASVLLTSRPTASAPLHNLPTVDRLVEVVGFNEENVKQYIESEFEKCPEKASSLIEELESNSVIVSVCSVPLNCAIICNLWHTLKGMLPKTLTELYTQIVLNIVLHDIRKKSSTPCPISLSFKSIPDSLQDVFWKTCEFAYECLSRDQVVFSEEELIPLFPEAQMSTEKCCGLLQCSQSLLPVGHGLSFHFIHLTIQEFLAALHLVTLPSVQILGAAFHTNFWNDRFAMVWKFMFGLGFTRESICGRKIIHLENRVIDYFISKLSSFALLLCHCAMESNDPIVSNKVANQLNGQLEGYIGSRARNPYDYAAVFHVLNHTSYCSYVRINLCRCSLRDNQLTELTDILSCANGKLQVRVLTLFENKLTDKGILDLFTSAPSSFKSLKSLCLNSNGITNVTPLFTACNCLTNLSLSDNPLRVLGVQSLDISVKAGTLACLTDLYLSNTLTNDADINGALLTTFLQSLASHCPQLRYLDLSRNNLSVPGAYALGETFPSLTSNRSRFELDLSGTNLDESITAFSNIIATKASKQSCSCRLKISHNLLGCDGLLAIFRILRKKMCHVISLYL